MTVQAFGPLAEQYAVGLGNVPALIADQTAPAQALAAAVKRRRRGEAFLSGVLIDDPRATVAYEFAWQLLTQQVDEDGRRRMFDALAVQGLKFGDVAQASVGTLVPAARLLLCDISMMGDGMLVRSWAEAERLAALFWRSREFVVRLPGEDLRVPAVTRRTGDAIVVWAAGLPARKTALFAYALKDFYLPVLIACDERPTFPAGSVQYVAPDESALQRAAVVIDASIGGPATAIALARRGIPLAVTTVSGAAEYLVGATPYEPWSWRSIHAAAQRALSGTLPTVCELPSADAAAETLAAQRSAIPRDGGLVSVLVPTYNRRDLLPRALDSLARQEYRNIEMVVVNDGGEPVDDIVARYPNARLLEMPANQGITATTNVAMQAARGVYITFCCDDDMLFPDAIGRWVRALSGSKARVANGNTVMRFDRRRDGRAETIGYRLIWKENVDHRDSLFTPFTPLSCVMLHRDVIDTLGYYEDSKVMDMEFLMRISRHHDFVHVDHPCSELEYDFEKGQGKAIGFAARAAALQKMYEKFPSDSADVAAGRSEKIAWHTERQAAGSYFEPDIALPEPEPPPSVDDVSPTASAPG